jgi:hypothetical protein
MSWYYTRQGFAILATDGEETGHTFGGVAYHEGAECPVCKVPLLLLADLDCSKLRKQMEEPLFQKLKRLPLYYCWGCCAEQLTYIIIDGKRIKVLRNEGSSQGDDFPYPNFPRAFPSRPILLTPIDYELGKLLAVYQEVDKDWLTKADQQKIKKRMKLLRHGGFSENDVNRHQVGGLLSLIQGHERVGCPNTKCRYYKLFKEGYAVRMKELAVLCNDPNSGLPMVESPEELQNRSAWNEWVQVVYWVCEECLAIAASNRCD